MSQVTENIIEKKNFLSTLTKVEDSFLGHQLWDKQKAEAFKQIQESGLPSTKDEEYKYYNISKQLDKFFLNPVSTEAKEYKKADFKEFLLGDLKANVLVFFNGVFSAEHSSIISDSKILSIQSLSDAVKNEERDLDEILLAETENQKDAFFLLNKAFSKQGVYVKISDNVICDYPIHFLYVSDTRDGAVVYQPKNLFSIGKSSQIQIVESFNSLGEEKSFSNIANTFKLGANSNLNYYKIENDSKQSYHHSSVRILQAKDSVASTYTLSLEGNMIRNNLHFDINGEGVTSNMNGLSLLSGKTIVDHHTIADHKFPHTESNELYKGVYDEQSRGVFNGKIFVREEAQKTNAFQSNKNILISDKASVETKPQLEIWADDVKCSHGCTIGQLDEEQVFYLRSRGIGETDAKAMLLYAFANEVTEGINIPELKDYVKEILMHRLLN